MPAAAVPGAQLWVQRYNGPANRDDDARAVAVSPAGDRVFVTGSRYAANDQSNYATVAYNAATGGQLWVARYNDPLNGGDDAMSLAVNPSGDRVFVTGTSFGGNMGSDYATVAYDAATGAQLWAKRYGSSADDWAASVAVSPAGDRVFVTGSINHVAAEDAPDDQEDYATVAYDAATGARLWVARYNGPANDYDAANSVTVSPGGGRVFVTGVSDAGSGNLDYATVAYRAATGAQLWAKHYDYNGDDQALSVAANPAGGAVFVTGTSATVAYNVATGAQLWAKTGPGNALSVSPVGGTVFVTGGSAPVAYDAATGAQLWAKTGPGNASVAVSPAGGKVYVTGTSPRGDYVTVAYAAATGAKLWVSRYLGPADGYHASSVAVSPGGDRVFVTGTSYGGATGTDYVTIAYSG
jgi:outer membrane protein assembly factor BamB